MEGIERGHVHSLHTALPFVAKDGMESDITRFDGELAEIQDKLEVWKTELERFLSSTPNSTPVSTIAKRVEAEHLLKEVGEIEEEVYILLDELDTEYRTSGETSKLPTKAEWATFLNRPATAIMPLIAKLEGEGEVGGRLQKWRDMPAQ